VNLSVAESVGRVNRRFFVAKDCAARLSWHFVAGADAKVAVSGRDLEVPRLHRATAMETKLHRLESADQRPSSLNASALIVVGHSSTLTSRSGPQKADA